MAGVVIPHSVATRGTACHARSERAPDTIACDRARTGVRGSFLPPSVLAEHGAAFDADLEAVLHPYTMGGLLTETAQFAYELARRRG